MTDTISEQLTNVLKQYAPPKTKPEELEYVAALVLDASEEHSDMDIVKLEQIITETLEDAEFLLSTSSDATTIESLSKQLTAVLRGLPSDDESEGERDSDPRKVMLERLQNQFAIGKTALVVLSEDEQWHEARITRQVFDESVDNSEPFRVEVEFIEFGKKQLVAIDDVVLDEDVADNGDEEDRTGLCAMCERSMNLTAHHVIPRVMHAKYMKKGYTREFLNFCIMICRQCHSKIHSTEDNKTLARDYNTLEKIMQHPEIIRYVNYAKKQKSRIRPVKISKWPVGK